MTDDIKKPLKMAARLDKRRVSSPVRRATTLALTIAVLAPVAVLSGCASHSERHFVVGSTNTTYEERHPILIDEKEQTLDIPVATNSFALTHASKGAIQGFLERYRQSASGDVTIMLPAGSPNEHAARKIGNSITQTAVNAGIPHSRLQLVTYHAVEHGTSAPIRLSYSAVNASVKGCGKWDEDLAAQNGENRNYRNFGCSSQANLAASIANPTDLLNPRGMTPIDAQRRGQAIDDYRSGNVRLDNIPNTNF